MGVFHQMGAPLTSQEAQLMQPVHVVKHWIKNNTRFWFHLDMIEEAVESAVPMRTSGAKLPPLSRRGTRHTCTENENN